jgi:hypothetical protein
MDTPNPGPEPAPDIDLNKLYADMDERWEGALLAGCSRPSAPQQRPGEGLIRRFLARLRGKSSGGATPAP